MSDIDNRYEEGHSCIDENCGPSLEKVLVGLGLILYFIGVGAFWTGVSEEWLRSPSIMAIAITVISLPPLAGFLYGFLTRARDDS
jgi:hypothetical protein